MTAIESPAKTHLKIFKDFFQLFLLKCISESMYGYVHHVSAVPAEARREGVRSPELELQVVVNSLKWGLEPNPHSL